MSEPTDEIKIACPHCGQHILIETSMIGTELQCPTCSQSFAVPEADADESETPVAEPPDRETGGEEPTIRRGIKTILRAAWTKGLRPAACFVAALAVVMAACVARTQPGSGRGTSADFRSSPTHAGSNYSTTERGKEDDHRGVREPTAAERTFKEGLDALRGENGQERDVAKAYRLFRQADEEGCILGEVGVAHICWTLTDADKQALKKAGITPMTLYIVNWRHASNVGNSRIAKCEFGLFQLQRDAYRNEGLKLLREAAAEGSDTAAMFLSRVEEQKNRSSLSYETILGLFAGNDEIMALFQKACEVELAKEYLLSLKNRR